MSIRTALKSGWIYSVGDNREAYIAISYSDSHPPLHIMLSFPFRAMKAVGTRPLYALSQLLKNGGPFLADRMKNNGEKFLSVEMLCVKREYQGERIHAEGYGRSLPICRWEKTSCSPGNR